MKTFNDNAGRTWTVAINVECIKRVKTLLSVNLLDAIEGKLIEQLVSDPVLLCDVIYAICKPEADTKEVSDEEFGRAMASKRLDDPKLDRQLESLLKEGELPEPTPGS